MNTDTSLSLVLPSETSTSLREPPSSATARFLCDYDNNYCSEEELTDMSWYAAPTPRYNPRTVNKAEVERSRQKAKLARKARRLNRKK